MNDVRRLCGHPVPGRPPTVLGYRLVRVFDHLGVRMLVGRQDLRCGLRRLALLWRGGFSCCRVFGW